MGIPSVNGDSFCGGAAGETDSVVDGTGDAVLGASNEASPLGMVSTESNDPNDILFAGWLPF